MPVYLLLMKTYMHIHILYIYIYVSRGREVLGKPSRPKRWGLDQILGPQWQDSSKAIGALGAGDWSFPWLSWWKKHEKSQFHPQKNWKKQLGTGSLKKTWTNLDQNICCRKNLWKHWFERHKNPRFPGHFSLPTRWSLVIETVLPLSFEPLLFNQWMLQCLLVLRSNLAYDNHEHHGFLRKMGP